MGYVHHRNSALYSGNTKTSSQVSIRSSNIAEVPMVVSSGRHLLSETDLALSESLCMAWPECW